MPSEREKLESEPLEQLADRMQDGPESGRNYYAPLAELERRKALWEEQAAEAAKKTAQYTRRTAFFMFLSVLALLVGSLFGPLLPHFFGWN